MTTIFDVVHQEVFMKLNEVQQVAWSVFGLWFWGEEEWNGNSN